MAITLTDSRATVTAGRGRNKLVVLDVSFAELDRWARKVQIDEARLWRRSYVRAMKGLQRKFISVIKHAGGIAGVPKFKDFEEFTKELRSIRGRTEPMGGVLTYPEYIWYYMDERANKCTLGWKKQYAKVAVDFQDGVGGPSSERYFTNSLFRRYWHEDGIKFIPRQYTHNQRRVLPEPFGGYVDQNLKTWAEHVFYKELARLMAKEAS